MDQLSENSQNPSSIYHFVSCNSESKAHFSHPEGRGGGEYIFFILKQSDPKCTPINLKMALIIFNIFSLK